MLQRSWLIAATLAATVLALPSPADQKRLPGTLKQPFVNQNALSPHTFDIGGGSPLECVQITNPVLTPQGLQDGNETLEASLLGLDSGPRPYSAVIVDYNFTNSYGNPFVANFEPPCSGFDRVVLNLTVTSEGRQFDRLGHLWLGDTEIWRTSTAEPKAHPGISWTFWKDVTPYLSLWATPQLVIFDLGNLVNEKYTGIFHVIITATFFIDPVRGPHGKPADLVLPVTAQLGHSQRKASAFRFPQDEAASTLILPRNIGRAAFSIAATGQADEEFWWSNVPESVADAFGHNAGSKLPGRSSFREARLRIDGRIAGLAHPFPTVFTGGISPPLHRPLVGLEAFDLREYEIDISAWLGVLCDGEPHTFSMEVVGIDDTHGEPGHFVSAHSEWLLSGKIFIWTTEDNEIPTVGNPPRVTLSGNNFHADVEGGIDDSVAYDQLIDRTLLIEAAIYARPSGEGFWTDMTWAQNMSMQNAGFLLKDGTEQNVQASYSGHSTATSEGDEYFTTKYRHPIVMEYKTRGQDRNHGLETFTKFSQGLEFVVTGWTSFVTGLEPFVRKLGNRIAGTGIYTSRHGSASLIQLEPGGEILGFGDMSQSYRLVAIEAPELGPSQREEDWTAPPIVLYGRNLTVVNETVTYDRRQVFELEDLPPLPAEPIQHSIDPAVHHEDDHDGYHNDEKTVYADFGHKGLGNNPVNRALDGVYKRNLSGASGFAPPRLPIPLND